MNQIQKQSTVIKNITQLRDYLQIAMKLEHATLPPYLTAAYTAKIETNKPAMDIIREVAKEEMLHLTLTGNLLNAVGGNPNLISEDFVPVYPTHLPIGEDTFEINIEKFSITAIETFLKIERPLPVREDDPMLQHISNIVPIPNEFFEYLFEGETPFLDVKKKDDGYYMNYDIALIPRDKLSFKRQQSTTKSFLPSVIVPDVEGNEIELHYWSIGEFYEAIHLGFVYLSKTMEPEKLFCGDRKRQIRENFYYSGGGAVIEVTDLKSALAAIELIAGQGEGSSGRVYDSDKEIAHYYRFDQIAKERYYRVPDADGKNIDEPLKPMGGNFPVDWNGVYPIKTNAKVSDYKDYPILEEQALLFNGQYKKFLALLNEAFNGNPQLLNPQDGTFAREMLQIKTAMERLIHNKIPGTGQNAAPTFEMNRFKYTTN